MRESRGPIAGGRGWGKGRGGDLSIGLALDASPVRRLRRELTQAAKRNLLDLGDTKIWNSCSMFVRVP